jgi:hypothetical protein
VGQEQCFGFETTGELLQLAKRIDAEVQTLETLYPVWLLSAITDLVHRIELLPSLT